MVRQALATLLWALIHTHTHSLKLLAGEMAGDQSVPWWLEEGEGVVKDSLLIGSQQHLAQSER